MDMLTYTKQLHDHILVLFSNNPTLITNEERSKSNLWLIEFENSKWLIQIISSLLLHLDSASSSIYNDKGCISFPSSWPVESHLTMSQGSEYKSNEILNVFSADDKNENRRVEIELIENCCSQMIAVASRSLDRWSSFPVEQWNHLYSVMYQRYLNNNKYDPHEIERKRRMSIPIVSIASKLSLIILCDIPEDMSNLNLNILNSKGIPISVWLFDLSVMNVDTFNNISNEAKEIILMKLYLQLILLRYLPEELSGLLDERFWSNLSPLKQHRLSILVKELRDYCLDIIEWYCFWVSTSNATVKDDSSNSNKNLMMKDIQVLILQCVYNWAQCNLPFQHGIHGEQFEQFLRFHDLFSRKHGLLLSQFIFNMAWSMQYFSKENIRVSELSLSSIADLLGGESVSKFEKSDSYNEGIRSLVVQVHQYTKSANNVHPTILHPFIRVITSLLNNHLDVVFHAYDNQPGNENAFIDMMNFLLGCLDSTGVDDHAVLDVVLDFWDDIGESIGQFMKNTVNGNGKLYLTPDSLQSLFDKAITCLLRRCSMQNHFDVDIGDVNGKKAKIMINANEYEGVNDESADSDAILENDQTILRRRVKDTLGCVCASWPLIDAKSLQFTTANHTTLMHNALRCIHIFSTALNSQGNEKYYDSCLYLLGSVFEVAESFIPEFENDTIDISVIDHATLQSIAIYVTAWTSFSQSISENIELFCSFCKKSPKIICDFLSSVLPWARIQCYLIVYSSDSNNHDDTHMEIKQILLNHKILLIEYLVNWLNEIFSASIVTPLNELSRDLFTSVGRVYSDLSKFLFIPYYVQILTKTNVTNKFLNLSIPDDSTGLTSSILEIQSKKQLSLVENITQMIILLLTVPRANVHDMEGDVHFLTKVSEALIKLSEAIKMPIAEVQKFILRPIIARIMQLGQVKNLTALCLWIRPIRGVMACGNFAVDGPLSDNEQIVILQSSLPVFEELWAILEQIDQLSIEQNSLDLHESLFDAVLLPLYDDCFLISAYYRYASSTPNIWNSMKQLSPRMIQIGLSSFKFFRSPKSLRWIGDIISDIPCSLPHGLEKGDPISISTYQMISNSVDHICRDIIQTNSSPLSNDTAVAQEFWRLLCVCPLQSLFMLDAQVYKMCVDQAVCYIAWSDGMIFRDNRRYLFQFIERIVIQSDALSSPNHFLSANEIPSMVTALILLYNRFNQSSNITTQIKKLIRKIFPRSEAGKMFSFNLSNYCSMQFVQDEKGLSTLQPTWLLLANDAQSSSSSSSSDIHQRLEIELQNLISNPSAIGLRKEQISSLFSGL